MEATLADMDYFTDITVIRGGVNQEYENGYGTNRESFRAVDWLATAHHEAGHAVAAYALGVPIEKIAIGLESCAGTGQYGESDLPWPEHPDTPLVFRAAHGIISCAGPVAELKFRQLHKLPIITYGYETDRDNIDFVTLAPDYNPDAIKRLIRRETRRLVHHPVIWRGICKLADELISNHQGYQETELSGREVKRILKRAGIRQKKVKEGGTIFPLNVT